MRFSTYLIPVVMFLVIVNSPATGQSTRFEPEIVASERYDSNVSISGEGDDASDWITELQILLPVRREWKTGSLMFSYAPSYSWYRDFDELSTDEHRVNLRLESEPDRRSGFDCGVRFERVLLNNVLRDEVESDLIMIGDSREDLVGIDARYSHAWGRRSGWSAAIEGSRSSIRSVGESGSAPIYGALEDRDWYGVSVGMFWDLARNSRLGVDAEQDLYDLEITGEEDVSRLFLTWTRQIGEHVEMDVRAGMFRRESENTSGGEDVAQVDDTDMLFSFDLTRSLRKSSLSISLGRSPSAGGVLEGTSTNNTAGIAFNMVPNWNWEWSVFSRYAKRDTTMEEQLDISSWTGGGSMEWRPGRKLGIRFEARWQNQQGSQGLPDISVFNSMAGLVWYPRGVGQ